MEARPVVRLNVGGRVFVTEAETLLLGKKPGELNFFDGLLASHATSRYVDGALWIDRDGALFEHILRWLRERKFKRRALLPENDLVLLRAEADFFLLSEMVADIDDRIAQRKASNSRTLFGALFIAAGAVGAALYLNRKQNQAALPEPASGSADASKFPMPAVSADDLAFCLLDELSLMKAQSLS